MSEERDESGRFAAGNAGAIKHGADSVAARIRDGRPLIGLAGDLQAEARADLERDGALACAREAACRHIAGALFAFGTLTTGTINPNGRLRILDLARKMNAQAFDMLMRLDQAEHERGGGDVIEHAVRAAQEAAGE